MDGKKYAVIGLGQFGGAVARSLASKGAEVLGIDQDEECVNDLANVLAHVVKLDSTNMEALNSQNITDMDCVLVAIGENIEGLLLTVVQLLELKVKRIVARAMNVQQKTILEKLGLVEILMPDADIGNTVAENLLNPEMKGFLPLPDDYEIVELEIPKRFLKRTITEIDFMENHHLELIAIKRKYDEGETRKRKVEHLITRPQGDISIEFGDVVIVLGKFEDIDRFVDV